MATPFQWLRRFNAYGVSMATPFQCLRRLKVSGFKVQGSKFNGYVVSKKAEGHAELVSASDSAFLFLGSTFRSSMGSHNYPAATFNS